MDADNDVEVRFESLISKFASERLKLVSTKESKSEQHNDLESHKNVLKKHSTGDMFPETPAVERYLEIPVDVRRERFFQSISIGDVVEGRVTDKWADDLIIRLDSVYFGPKRWLKDLNIKAECDLLEFKTHSGTRRLSDSISDFDIGDLVRGVVCNINVKSWKIAVSFRRGLLPDVLSHIELGAVLDPQHESWDFDNDDSYLESLQSSHCFSNPECVNNLVSAVGIVTNKPCTFHKSLLSDVDPDEFAEKLRNRQSTKWSMEMVAEGVKLFKQRKHEEAMKCFDQALQMHATNVEAFVARGALKANQNLLKSAIEDFYKAIAVHPSHRNGQKYLCETLITLAKQYEKDRLWKDASRRYKEVLQINPENEEAMDRFHQIQLILSQQVLAGKRTSLSVNTVAPKSAEVASVAQRGQSKNLKELLKEKIRKKSKKEKRARNKASKSKKKEKKKKKRKLKRSKSEHASPSSSSATSSDTDPDATDSASEKPNSDGEWVEKVVEHKMKSKAETLFGDYECHSQSASSLSERSKRSIEDINHVERTSVMRRVSRSLSDERPSKSCSKHKFSESTSSSSTISRRISFNDNSNTFSTKHIDLKDTKHKSARSESAQYSKEDSEKHDINELISHARYGHTKDSYDKKLKRDRAQDKEQTSIPSEKLKNKHFSFDEIGFISQILSKKPNKD